MQLIVLKIICFRDVESMEKKMVKIFPAIFNSHLLWQYSVFLTVHICICLYLIVKILFVVDLNRVHLNDPLGTGEDYINASYVGVMKTTLSI